jgi:hypothetical protein
MFKTFAKVQDPIVRRYWTDQLPDFRLSQIEVLDYIVSKFGRFVTNKTMRILLVSQSLLLLLEK